MASSSTDRKRQPEITTEMLASVSAVPKEKKSPKKSKPLPESKFGGMMEEEVCKLLLPDHMKAGLDIIFVSIYCSCSSV